MWFTLKKLFPICNGSTINLGYWESMHATETDNGHEKHASKSAKFMKKPGFLKINDLCPSCQSYQGNAILVKS